jgi:hypothetical protein
VIGEADTYRKYVEPKLDAAGWNDPPHSYSEQVYFTDGHIVVRGKKVRRRSCPRAPVNHFLLGALGAGSGRQGGARKCR